MVFIRNIENFTCEHCNFAVVGNGYTNHCPKCLWSKHVDEQPGDRASSCGGMMEPVALEGSTPHYRISHRCIRCGMIKIVTASEDDDAEALVALAKKGS